MPDGGGSIYFTNAELDALAGALYAAASEGAFGEVSILSKIEAEANARGIETFTMPWRHRARTPGDWRRIVEVEL